jgi:transposase-like protein
MTTSPYRGFRFPKAIIQHAIWLYFRFTLSLRDVEELLAERGIAVTYETVRRWVLKFGPAFARNLRRLRPRPTGRWHLDEMVVSIQGRRMYLWRAVDSEGEVLDLLVQARRDTAAALRLMRKLLKKQGYAPDELVTDKLGSYGAARRDLGLSAHHEQGTIHYPTRPGFLRQSRAGPLLGEPRGPRPELARNPRWAPLRQPRANRRGGGDVRVRRPGCRARLVASWRALQS